MTAADDHPGHSNSNWPEMSPTIDPGMIAIFVTGIKYLLVDLVPIEFVLVSCRIAPPGQAERRTGSVLDGETVMYGFSRTVKQPWQFSGPPF